MLSPGLHLRGGGEAEDGSEPGASAKARQHGAPVVDAPRVQLVEDLLHGAWNKREGSAEGRRT